MDQDQTQTASAVAQRCRVLRLRGVLSMLSLVESGDAIVGATAQSLTMRKDLRADVERISAEISGQPDGERTLRRATQLCHFCGGSGLQLPSYLVEPPKCPKCKGTTYRYQP